MLEKNSTYIFWLSFLILGLTPLICYTISVQQGHTLVFLSTVSANYMFPPARWYCGIGISLFVIQQLCLQTPWTKVYAQADTPQQNTLIRYERLLLLLLVIISWVPLGWIIGLHALLAGPWFLGTIHWLSCLLPRLPTHTSYIVYRLYTLTCLGTFCMAISFPWSILIDLSTTTNYQDKLRLFALDPRWTAFACAEWCVMYSLIACIGALRILQEDQKDSS